MEKINIEVGDKLIDEHLSETGFWKKVSKGQGFKYKSTEKPSVVQKISLCLRGCIKKNGAFWGKVPLTVRVCLPTSLSIAAPSLSAPVNPKGLWEIDLSTKINSSLLHKFANSKKQINMKLSVYNDAGKELFTKNIITPSAFKDFHVLSVRFESSKPAPRKTIQRVKVANLPKNTGAKNLLLEVWETEHFEGTPITTATPTKQNIFELHLNTPKSDNPYAPTAYWLRLVRTKKKIEVGSCPVFFDIKYISNKVRTVTIHKDMPKLFALANKAKYAFAQLSLSLLKILNRNQIVTLKQMCKGHPDIPDEILQTWRDLGNMIKELFPEIEPETIEDYTLTEAIEWTDRVLEDSVGTVEVGYCWLEQEQWQYRFDTWKLNDFDKHLVFSRYAKCAELPLWRELVHNFFSIHDGYRIGVLARHKITDSIAEQHLKIQSILSNPSSIAAISLSVKDAIRDLNIISTEIDRKIKEFESKSVSSITVTTYTGSGSHDGTDDWVRHNALFPILDDEEGVQRGCWEGWITMGDRNALRNQGDVNVFDEFPMGCGLIQFGNLQPKLWKKGRDGWQLNNWHIEVEHNGVTYTHLAGIDEPVWLKPKDNSNSDVVVFGIEDWFNPYHAIRKELELIKLEINSLCGELANSLFGQIDNCLSPLIQGNQKYRAENWSGAVEAYRSCLASVRGTQYYDRYSAGFKRLNYILLLHIGDCYWRNHEYERACRLFLATGLFRKPGCFDDHFLWNHVAECMLDWADYRYLKCGNNSIKFNNFGQVDDAQMIDPLHTRPLTNKDGPLKLYRRVLDGGFQCPNWFPRIPHRFDESMQKDPDNQSIIEDFDLTPFPVTRCDFSWQNWYCQTFSNILLKRAQIGVDKISAGYNALGYITDYIPPDRFTWLANRAKDVLREARRQVDKYDSARKRLAEQIELAYELEYLLDIAINNFDIKNTQKERIHEQHKQALQSIDQISARIQKLEESRAKVIAESIIGSFLSLSGKNFGTVAKSIANDETPKLGAVASMAVNNLPSLSGAVASSTGVGLIVFLAGAVIEMVPEMTINAIKANENLNDKIQAENANLGRARKNVEQKYMDLLIAGKELEIASLEKAYLKSKIETLSQTNLQNPAFWDKTMKIHYNLCISHFIRAIKNGWLAERALYYEIANFLDGQREMPTIRFDYLYPDLTDLLSGIDIYENDLASLEEFRFAWYRNYIQRFHFEEISFRHDFLGELMRIKLSQGRRTNCSFRTTIKMFDQKNRTANLYQRIKSVRCYYDTGDSGTVFNADLKNGHADGAVDDGNIVPSYWRSITVGEDTEETERPVDWLQLDGYQLSMKPALSDAIHVYPLTEAPEVEELENLTNENIDHLLCFENSGLESDWTLRLSKQDDASWNSLQDIKVQIRYWAIHDPRVVDAIFEAEGREVRHYTFIQKIDETAPAPFKEVFEPGNKFTDELSEPNTGIPFSLEAEDAGIACTSGIRHLTGLSLLVFFDDQIVNEHDIPKLVFRLRKKGSGLPDGGDIEIMLTSPSPAVSSNNEPGGNVSEQFLASDLIADWEIEMRSSDNRDSSGAQVRFRGLRGIYLIFDYSCHPLD